MSENNQEKQRKTINGQVIEEDIKEGIKEGRLEDKYDSDLTRKEKRLLEKQRLKGMGPGKKLQYIWMYHKPQIFGIIGVIILIFVCKDWYENAKMQEILSIYIVNAGMSETEPMETELKELLGSTDQYEYVEVNGGLSTDADMTEFEYNSQMAFVAKMQAQTIDILMTSEEMCEKLQEQEMFAEMSDILDEDTLAAFGENADQYYLRLTEDQLPEEIELPYSPACVAVLANTKNMDNAVTWISSLVGEQEKP